MIYLDYSANTPADPQVLDRFCSVERRCIGNANSHHQAGTAARAEIDAATLKIAALLGVGLWWQLALFAAGSAVLLATILGQIFGWRVDGWAGLAVAGFILYAGIGAARDTISPLLGNPPTPEFVEEIRSLVMAHPEVLGIHDLVVHDYGPGRRMISLHAEVPASGDLLDLHDVIDSAEQELRRQLGCEAVIHMDPIATDDSTTVVLRNKITELAHCIDPALSIHDFRMVTGPTHTNVIFDAVVPYGCKMSDREAEEKIKKAVHELDPSYFAVVQIDKSYVR